MSINLGQHDGWVAVSVASPQGGPGFESRIRQAIWNGIFMFYSCLHRFQKSDLLVRKVPVWATQTLYNCMTNKALDPSDEYFYNSSIAHLATNNTWNWWKFTFWLGGKIKECSLWFKACITQSSFTKPLKFSHWTSGGSDRWSTYGSEKWH